MFLILCSLSAWLDLHEKIILNPLFFINRKSYSSNLNHS